MTQTTAREFGVTGTRRQPSEAQRDKFRYLANFFWAEGFRIQHNGDCVGSDTFMGKHWKSAFAGSKLYGHPPVARTHRAFLTFDVMAPTKPYLERNHDIVREGEWIVAMPNNFQEQFTGSGTWATIRYAEKAGKPLFIIYPDGSMEIRNGQNIRFS